MSPWAMYFQRGRTMYQCCQEGHRQCGVKQRICQSVDGRSSHAAEVDMAHADEWGAGVGDCGRCFRTSFFGFRQGKATRLTGAWDIHAELFWRLVFSIPKFPLWHCYEWLMGNPNYEIHWHMKTLLMMLKSHYLPYSWSLNPHDVPMFFTWSLGWPGAAAPSGDCKFPDKGAKADWPLDWPKDCGSENPGTTTDKVSPPGNHRKHMNVEARRIWVLWDLWIYKWFFVGQADTHRTWLNVNGFMI